jgi:hypothetical protein
MFDWATFQAFGIFLTALMLGGMVFFAFLLTPIAFTRMSKEAGTEVIRTTFPYYYRVMAALSVGASLLVTGSGNAIILAANAMTFALILMFLRPRIVHARQARDDGESDAASTFQRLHRASVILNMSQLAAVIVVFFRLAGQ